MGLKRNKPSADARKSDPITRTRRVRFAGCWVAGLLALAGVARAEQPLPSPTDPAGVAFFEKKIRPVLSQYCYKCHSTTADKLKAGLYLDSRDGALKGGETGPSVVPGHPEKSLLIEAVGYKNADMQMPPKSRLPGPVVADLTEWVRLGAPWPKEAAKAPAEVAAVPRTPTADYEKQRREHWAWQPVKAVSAPAVKDASWPRGDVDRFLLAAMEQKGVKPVADADKLTFIRRVTFDLTGLPPTPAEVQAFLADTSPDASAKLVDRLLASLQFGVRWGRHWLDVARYGESTGSARNVPYPEAWRYRDYVIDSFNQDKPYDRFIAEQIAGDLLPAEGPARRNEQLVATGYLAIGVKDLNERDRAKFTMDNVDEQIDVMSRSILATTISCARCHDHKFDPIPTADYYSLAGIFRDTQILSGVHSRQGMTRDYADPSLLVRLDGRTAPAAQPVASAAPAAPPVPSPAARPGFGGGRARALLVQLDKARLEFQAARDEAEKKGPGGGRYLVVAQKKDAIQKIREELEALQNGNAQGTAQGTAQGNAQGGFRPGNPAANAALGSPAVVGEPSEPAESPVEPPAAPPVPAGTPDYAAGGLAMGVRDVARPDDCKICLHGDADNPGPQVPRGFISLIHFDGQPAVDPSHSGRLELAQWLASEKNPLTARVMVNRIWQHLFGEGLVRTVDNFGSTGEAPSHPELLDFLATQFTRDGWSVKHMVRTLVLSRAYQLDSKVSPADFEIDPGNRLLWRMAPKRLEAEAIRDAMLAASGQLDLKRPHGSPVSSLGGAELRGPRFADGVPGEGTTHRSVYLPIVRNLVPEVLDVFDFAEPTMVTGARDTTTVATQALFVMNDPFVIEQSRRMAARVLSEGGGSSAPSAGDDARRVELAYKLALCRPPTAAERQRTTAYLSDYARDAARAPGAPRDPAKLRAEAWASFCQVLLASAEFRYLN